MGWRPWEMFWRKARVSSLVVVKHGRTAAENEGQLLPQVDSRSVSRFKDKLKAYSQPNIRNGKGINRY
jgi:hypothetical protein